MDVFIGNLPGEATIEELRQFVGDIKLHANYNCHKGHDRSDSHYYFFIAELESEQAAHALIQRIDGTLFLGHRISAREFIPRTTDGPAAPCTEIERRINDDRRGEQICLNLG